MADIQLRDEAVRDRIRAAEEFLDPSEFFRLLMNSFYVRLQGIDDARARRYDLSVTRNITCDLTGAAVIVPMLLSC